MLAPACAKQIFKLQVDAATDFRADPDLYQACKDDAGTLCEGVKFGGGRVQSCLVSACVAGYGACAALARVTASRAIERDSPSRTYKGREQGEGYEEPSYM